MTEIDWRHASEKERQILYRYLKAEIDTRNMTLYQLIEEATGSVAVGHGYDANMRSGRFSRKSAYQFFDWLEQKNPARAASVAEEILAAGNSTAEGWQKLVGGFTGPIAIIEHPERQDLVRFADDQPVQRVALGKPFFLRIHCPANGFAIGFQQTKSLWYPLPLGREPGWVSVHGDDNDLPCRADGTVDPLVEETETGPVQFVILFAAARAEFKQAANPTAPLSRQRLDAFADALDQSPPPFVFSSRVLIT